MTEGDSTSKPLIEGEDYTIDPEGFMVFTAAYLKKRGYCCHQGCQNCPYDNDDEPNQS